MPCTARLRLALHRAPARLRSCVLKCSATRRAPHSASGAPLSFAAKRQSSILPGRIAPRASAKQSLILSCPGLECALAPSEGCGAGGPAPRRRGGNAGSRQRARRRRRRGARLRPCRQGGSRSALRAPSLVAHPLPQTGRTSCTRLKELTGPSWLVVSQRFRVALACAISSSARFRIGT